MMEIPKGWALVPLKPTPEMIEAAEQTGDLYRLGQPDMLARAIRAANCAAPDSSFADGEP